MPGVATSVIGSIRPNKTLRQQNVSDSPYSKFVKDEWILRDYLAVDRTVLANERTFLAYIRTALTLFIAGVSFIQFFDSVAIEVVGWIFVPVGIATFIVGFTRYNKMKGLVQGIKEDDTTTPNTH